MRIVSALFIASSIVVGVSAQAGPPAAAQGQQPTAPREQPATQQPAAPQPAAPRAPAKVTISGCIQNAPAAAATGGAAPSTPAAKFVLANAKPIGGAAGGAVGTAGAAAATRYQLEGEDKTISPHVNHQVEIMGTVQSAAPSAGGTTGAAAGPMLKVDSVKMLADKCS
ncbi:MAG TPA: hypothetical protein VIK60_18130 [Vicinamibacterales bacterium]